MTIHDIKDKNITLTPLRLINKLGIFDLDPCGLQFHKTATKIISLPDDGLVEEWAGRVWLNPPYSNPKPFIRKLSEHGNGIALVLNSTDTNWFQEYGLKKAHSILLLKGRPKFTRMDMSRVSIMRGVVLFAYGNDNSEALRLSGIEGEHFYLK
jgi:DNA N-6-adenine-methyltransferase (Dam)